MGDKVITVGIEMPDDFPIQDYNHIHSKMQLFANSHPTEFAEYGGGWNALAYRFSYTADNDDEFREALKNNDRYLQERGLFGFFVSGLSVVESFSYALYFIGSILDAARFPISTEEDLRNVNPGRTANRFQAAFPGSDISDVVSNVVKSNSFTEWKLVRNILAHRSTPGRHISVELAPEQFTITDSPESPPPAPSPTQQQRRTDVWKLQGLSIDEDLTSGRRAWIAGVLADLMQSARRFVDDRT